MHFIPWIDIIYHIKYKLIVSLHRHMYSAFIYIYKTL